MDEPTYRDGSAGRDTTDIGRRALTYADDALSRSLALLQVLTPEGWEKAYAEAAKSGWHTGDLAMLRDARLLSMRGGPRYRPSPYGEGEGR